MSALTYGNDGMTEVCSVRVGKTLYGIPIICILEILGKHAVQPVPLAPPYIGGLVYYRGEVLTTVSLRHLLRMPPVNELEDIVIFESQDGYFGLLVDAVGEVLRVHSSSFEENPPTLDVRHMPFLAGTYKMKDHLLVILNSEQLAPMRLAETIHG